MVNQCLATWDGAANISVTSPIPLRPLSDMPLLRESPHRCAGGVTIAESGCFRQVLAAGRDGHRLPPRGRWLRSGGALWLFENDGGDSDRRENGRGKWSRYGCGFGPPCAKLRALNIDLSSVGRGSGPEIDGEKMGDGKHPQVPAANDRS